MAISTPARSTSTLARPTSLTREDRRILVVVAFLGAAAGVLAAAPLVAAAVVAGGSSDLTPAALALCAVVGLLASAYVAVRGRFVAHVGMRVGATLALLLGVGGGLLPSVVPGSGALVLGVLAQCAGLGLVVALGIEASRGVRRPLRGRAAAAAGVPFALLLALALAAAEVLASTGTSAQLLVVPTLALVGVLAADLLLRDGRGRRL